MLKNFPNQLTLFRIGVVPVLLVLFPLPFSGIKVFCAVLFAIASLTDWLDGFIARTFQAESSLGALLDPIADKLLMTCAIVLLTAADRMWPWMAGLFLCREMAVSGLRLVALQQQAPLEVSLLGKWKTLVLDVGLFGLLLDRSVWNIPMREAGMFFSWVALVLSLYSGWLYFASFFRTFDWNQPK
jgi:CDP-diacylglycerol--glycerol-3-phosphate 3-phosphatidyltransferase